MMLWSFVVGTSASADIYNQSATTLKGCECTSSCKTALHFECDVAPFCSVKSKDCAKGTADWSLTAGYYDWCEFNAYKKYEDLQAAEKKALVLAHVTKNKFSGHYPAALSLLAGIMGESVMTSFDASADVFPQDRKKYIHSIGATGGIRFDSVGGHPYTGLFEGADHGIIRLSSANEPGKGGFTPGMGIKFFRDGRPSANFVAMYSLDGQTCEDADFFKHDWSNHISATSNFALKLLAAKFWQASYCPLMVGLSDISSPAEGQVGVFPFRLRFHALLSRSCNCTDYEGCMKNLESLAAGQKLFEVYAEADPGAAEVLIGHISITDPLTTSKFGDEELFFKHQRMETDFQLQPKWLAAIDRKAQCGMGCTGTEAPPISKGCSSPFNGSESMLSDDFVVTV